MSLKTRPARVERSVQHARAGVGGARDGVLHDLPLQGLHLGRAGCVALGEGRSDRLHGPLPERLPGVLAAGEEVDVLGVVLEKGGAKDILPLV